jgi:DNA-binding transcriptional LysR family regulator
MLDLRKLEIFLTVYETRSFSKASKTLYLSQPTITLHIKELEKILGVPLFDRHTRKVVPTKAAEVVYRYGKELLNTLKLLEKGLQPFRDEKHGLVEVGGSTIPGQYILPSLIKLYKEEYPEVTIFLTVGDTQEILEKVLTGEVEIGMVGAYVKNKDLKFLPCYQDEIVLIAPIGVEKEEVSPEELLTIPLIKREQGSGTWKTVLSVLEKAKVDFVKLKIVGEMGSTEAVKEAVKCGLGWGFVSRLAVQSDLKLGLLKVVKIKGLNLKRHFYLVYHKHKKLTPCASKFAKFLEEKFNLSKKA